MLVRSELACTPLCHCYYLSTFTYAYITNKQIIFISRAIPTTCTHIGLYASAIASLFLFARIFKYMCMCVSDHQPPSSSPPSESIERWTIQIICVQKQTNKPFVYRTNKWTVGLSIVRVRHHSPPRSFNCNLNWF